MAEEILELKAVESIKANEQFGNMDKQLRGIGGTLHIVSESQKYNIIDHAWQLNKDTKLPVVVVVRALN